MRSSLVRRTPSQPFTGLIDQFFDGGFFTPITAGDRGPWIPAVDLGQTDDAYTVIADLPGLTKDDINLTVEDRALTLSGERVFVDEEKKEENARSFDRIERAYGKFSRTFHLPSNVDSSKVAASFKDGVLTIEIPKLEQAKSRQIKIS